VSDAVIKSGNKGLAKR